MTDVTDLPLAACNVIGDFVVATHWLDAYVQRQPEPERHPLCVAVVAGLDADQICFLAAIVAEASQEDASPK